MDPTIVPWRTPEQFLKVYEYVYSEELGKKRWAVDQMDIWETRCWPALPFPVEATLFMVRANIQDKLCEADTTLAHAREVEMMYCTAIVRFINLLLEKDNKMNETMLLTEIAEMKNIPAWIVEVRHSATHGFCPSLPVLRMAYRVIMENLEFLFWAPESKRISLFKKTFDTKPLMVLLQEYRTIQHQNSKSTGGDRLIKKALKMVCRKISHSLTKVESRNEFLRILVHPDHFVTKEDINCLKENDKKSFIEDNSGILPKVFKDFWNPLLEILHRYECIPEFLELLLLSQEKRTIKVFQKIADYLVLHVLNLRYCADNGGPLKIAFIKNGPIYSYFRLLYACMKGSSDSSKIVFDRLSAFLPLGDWTQELFNMLSIRHGLTLGKESNNRGQKRKFDITLTVGDLEEDIYTEMANRNPMLKKNHWSLAPINMDFTNIQLGHVFNPVEKDEKDDIKQEIIDKKPVLESIMVTPATEESMPIEAPKLANFIFQKLPPESYMIYRRRNKK